MITDRVTVDIDYYVPSARLKVVRAYYALRNHSLVTEVRVHVSTSGKGFHLQGYLSERLSDSQRDALRQALHDDEQRAQLDNKRGSVGHATDIFWTEKDGNDGERLEVADVWAALDYVEMNRATDHSRVKAIAQHGHKAVWDTHRLNRASLAEVEQ